MSDSHTPPQFFIEPDMLLGNQIVLVREVLRHARAQRLEAGETFRAALGDTVYLAEVSEVLPDRLVAEIVGRNRAVAPVWRVHLLASLLKGQNFDLVVEKATEVGVSSITPVVTVRTIPRFDQGKAAERKARWQKVAKAASEQSGRGSVTEICDVIALDELLKRAGGMPDTGPVSVPGTRLLAYEHEGLNVPLEQALFSRGGAAGAATGTAAVAGRLPTAEVSVLVGPEGGLDAAEVKQALAAGFVPVSLGPYIMKAETASIAAVSLLVHYLSKRD